MSADDLLAALDPEQREVATALRGPVRVLAGAGTGKTRAITHRIAYGVACGVYNPMEVLAVTFTTRAAGDQAELGRDQLRRLPAVDPGPEVAHLAQRRRVERARLHPRGTQHPEPTAHLAGGPGGEGDRQHLRRRVGAGADQVRDPVRDGPRLAGAGAGEHADRAGRRQHRRSLPIVEAGQHVHSHRNMLAHLYDRTGLPAIIFSGSRLASAGQDPRSLLRSPTLDHPSGDRHRTGQHDVEG